MYSGRPRATLNKHFFISCQIDVDNKQLFSPLSWNKPLSKNKVSQFNTSQKELVFYKIFVYQSGKWPENFLY